MNKYTYGKDPNAVSSNTVGIDLSGGFGSTMKVNDTAEPIELEIPPGSPAPPPDTMLAYTHLVQTIQRVDVTDNRSNIFLECEPLFNLSVKLFIFIKKDKTPTLDNHDWNITLPQEFPPPKNTSNMTEEEKLQQTLKWKVILEGSTNITTKNMTAAGT